MRRLLALVGLLVVMAAPYAEYSHCHWMGQSHDDCPGCQVSSNPADQVVVQTTPVGPLGYHTAPPFAPPVLRLVADPLRVAPKTSPPSVAA